MGNNTRHCNYINNLIENYIMQNGANRSVSLLQVEGFAVFLRIVIMLSGLMFNVKFEVYLITSSSWAHERERDRLAIRSAQRIFVYN